jgi:hypothetical protein
MAMKFPVLIKSVLIVVLGASLTSIHLAGQTGLSTQQIIIRFLPQSWKSVQTPEARDCLLRRWEATYETNLTYVREFANHGWIVRLERNLSPDKFKQLVKEISNDPVVEYAEDDAQMTIQPLQQHPPFNSQLR